MAKKLSARDYALMNSLGNNAYADDLGDLQDQIDQDSVAPTDIQNQVMIQNQVEPTSIPPQSVQQPIAPPNKTGSRQSAIDQRNSDTRERLGNVINQSFEDQKQGIRSQAELLKRQQDLNAHPEFSATPLLRLLDTVYKTKYADKAPPDMSEDEKIAREAKLQEMLQSSKEKLTSDQTKALKGLLEHDESMRALGQGTRDAVAIQRTLNFYDQKQKPIENQLDSADRVLSILDQIKQGKLQGNKAISADISNTLAAMFGGGRPTVYGASHQEFDSAYGKMENWLNYLKGTANTVIPPEQLEQLGKDLMAMRNEYAIQHQKIHQGFFRSTPDMFKPAIKERYEASRQERGLPLTLTNNAQAATPAGIPAPGQDPEFDKFYASQKGK